MPTSRRTSLRALQRDIHSPTPPTPGVELGTSLAAFRELSGHTRLQRLRSPACEILLPARAPRAGPRRGRRAVRRGRGRRGLGGPGPAPVGRRGDAARKMASRASPREVSNHTASSAMAQLSVSASSCGLDFRGLKPVSRHRAEGVLCQESQSPLTRGREAARCRGQDVERSEPASI